MPAFSGAIKHCMQPCLPAVLRLLHHQQQQIVHKRFCRQLPPYWLLDQADQGRTWPREKRDVELKMVCSLSQRDCMRLEAHPRTSPA